MSQNSIKGGFFCTELDAKLKKFIDSIIFLGNETIFHKNDRTIGQTIKNIEKIFSVKVII